MRRFASIAFIMVVAFGCISRAPSAGPSDTSPRVPSPSTAASNAAQVGATSSASAAPAMSQLPSPPPDLARVAVAERDDVRVEIELQRNPLRAGEPSWIKTRVTNEGRTDVTWFHDGCAVPVSVHGVSEVAWPMGEEHTGQADKFKAYALGGSVVEGPDAHGMLSFVNKARLHSGPGGCADIGIGETIKPGQTIRTTRWWSGFTDLNRALPVAGPATFRDVAGYYWRGEEPEDITAQVIELKLDGWIVSPRAAHRLSPAEAVDAALSEPRFAAYLETQTIANGRAEIAWYDSRRDVWEIGVMPWYETDPPRIHGVLVDAVTGKVLGPLDRPWNQDVDPFP